MILTLFNYYFPTLHTFLNMFALVGIMEIRNNETGAKCAWNQIVFQLTFLFFFDITAASCLHSI